MQNQELIVEKVRLLFPRNKFDEVLSVLDDYGHESWQASKGTVQLAALKMSNGKLERLRQYMKTAREDYRDLLLVAMSPNQFRWEMTSKNKLSEEDRAQVQHQDEKQWETWLRGSPAQVCEHCTGVGIIAQSNPEPHPTSGLNLPSWVECPVCYGTGVWVAD